MPAKGDPAVGTGTVGTIADRLGRWFPALAGALLGGVLLWRFALRAIPERLRRRSALRRCLARLEAACLGSDPSAAGHALLEWGGASWGAARPLTLGGLAARLDDPEAAVILRRLDAALYSGRAGAWDSGQCLQGMRRILMARRAFRYPRPPSPLPPLNP